MRGLRHIAALIVLLPSSLHAAARIPQPAVTRVHVHHLVEYRTISRMNATAAALHLSTRQNPAPPAPAAQFQPNPFAYLVRSLLGLSSRP